MVLIFSYMFHIHKKKHNVRSCVFSIWSYLCLFTFQSEIDDMLNHWGKLIALCMIVSAVFAIILPTHTSQALHVLHILQQDWWMLKLQNLTRTFCAGQGYAVRRRSPLLYKNAQTVSHAVSSTSYSRCMHGHLQFWIQLLLGGLYVEEDNGVCIWANDSVPNISIFELNSWTVINHFFNQDYV